MKCFLPTEVSSEIFLKLSSEQYKNLLFQDLISGELRTKRSGISTRTTPATVDLQVTMVYPILTSPPTLSCNPSNPPQSYSSSITSRQDHENINIVICEACVLLQTAGRTTLCSILQCSSPSQCSQRFLQPPAVIIFRHNQNNPGQPRLHSPRMSLRLKCSSDICCNLFRRQQDLQMIFLILLVQ